MLTKIAIKPLKAKFYRVLDAAGLCVEVHPNGGTHWRFRYHHAGKEQMVCLGRGTFP